MPANTTLPFPSESLSLSDPGLALVTLEQERFNRFIWSENERLNRLIRNLYLYLLQFEHYSERDLYDRICQEVAEYFRASSCELYLVRYEEEEYDQSPHRYGTTIMPPSSHTYRLAKWLELVGAYGQGRRALQQRYVRRAERLRYELPLGYLDAHDLTGMTRLAFISEDPTRYVSGYDHRATRNGDPKPEEPDVPRLRTHASRQVVWYQDGLHNSFRCSLMASNLREGRDSADFARTPDYRRIGLIKVENRLPHGVAGYTESLRSGTDQSYLFFLEEWRIAALRPYVRDLFGSVKRGGNPFFPLHNNVGWRQYFDDHPLGATYFQQLLQELDQKSKSNQHSADKKKLDKKLREGYDSFSHWLEKLVECLIRLESWVQHLGYACRLLCGLVETPLLDKSVPSLFNVYNLRAAYLPLLFEPRFQTIADVPQSRSGASNEEVLLYEAMRDALFDCLAADQDEDRSYLGLLETIWHDVQRTKRCVDRIATDVLSCPKPLDEFTKRTRLSEQRLSLRLQSEIAELSAKLESLTREPLSPLDDDTPRRKAALHESLDTILLLVEQEAEDLIQMLCKYRVESIRLRLGSNVNSSSMTFSIADALEGTLPKWDFHRAMTEEVTANLGQICERLSSKASVEQTRFFELRTEEIELRRVSSIVSAILNDDEELIRRHSAACTLPEGSKGTKEHDDIGCKTARALAAAVMYADSFNPLDEKRLIFIASHVAQVLDNYLLHQARQRGLDLDYKALDVMGLEHFGLELLDSLRACTERMNEALLYLLEREVQSAALQDIHLRGTGGSINGLVKKLGPGQCTHDSHTENSHVSEGMLAYPLAAVFLDYRDDSGDRVATREDLNRVVARVLKRILRNADFLGLSPQVIGTLGADPTEVKFRPHNLVLKNVQDCAMVRLVLIEPTGSTRTVGIRLLVDLDNALLLQRDERVLWAAVRTLEHVLQAMEQAVGERKR